MGKGNFILGTGSSSIGDVTFARRNGQQIARVRVRKIKNPKSYGQAEQRMISAEVVKFYSPLSGVLETSFEGLSKSESYAKFLSVNNNLMRADAIGVEKGSAFKAIPTIVSNGSLPTPSVSYSTSEETLYFEAGTIEGSPSSATMGALSTALKTKYGVEDGDQVTLIWVTKNAKGEQTAKYMRFYVDTTDTATILSKGLTVNASSDVMGIFPTGTNVDGIALAVIFSRWDGEKWARSNSRMVCTDDYLATLQGTNYNAAILTYMNGGGRTPVSDVYLNGSDDE